MPFHTVIEGQPTHVVWRDDVPEFVRPDGFTEAAPLELLPEGFWDGPMRPDPATRSFSPDLASARAALWEAVKAKRFAIELGGCATPLGRMDSDVVSQQKLIGAVTMAMLAAQGGSPLSGDLTKADNSTVAHDGPAIIAAGMAMGTFVATAHGVAVALRSAIEAADSFADLDAIDIEAAPWPGEGQE
jgi:hypothetical protein